MLTTPALIQLVKSQLYRAFIRGLQPTDALRFRYFVRPRAVLYEPQPPTNSRARGTATGKRVLEHPLGGVPVYHLLQRDVPRIWPRKMREARREKV
jgi:hypothetical protein